MTILTLESLRSKRPCRAGDVISTLSRDDQDTLKIALSGPEKEFPSARISNVLATLGISVTKDTIIRHRRSLCGCDQSRE